MKTREKKHDPTAAARQRAHRRRRRAGRVCYIIEAPTDLVSAALWSGIITAADVADEKRLRRRLGDLLDAFVTEQI